MFEHPRTAMQALQLLEHMPAIDAISILLDGLQKHQSSKVRARCATTLLPYDLDDSQLVLLIQSLEDPSAAVRQATASFFGLRGTQRRPVYAALRPLIDAVNKNDRRIEGDQFEEMIAITSFPMTVAAAIKTTVGAEKLMLRLDTTPFNLQEIHAAMEGIASDPSDPQMAEDAKKYLRFLASSAEFVGEFLLR